MGLDMYLFRRSYVKNWDHQSDEQKHKITVKLGGKTRKDIKPERISHITEDVGYWRKQNHIHKWFVDECQGGVDDCREAYVSREKLQELLNLCKQVQSIARLVPGQVEAGATMGPGGWVPHYQPGIVVENAEEVAALLPCVDGFFFGGTEYYEWHMEGIKHTIAVIEEIMAIPDDEADYYYVSSW